MWLDKPSLSILILDKQFNAKNILWVKNLWIFKGILKNGSIQLGKQEVKGNVKLSLYIIYIYMSSKWGSIGVTFISSREIIDTSKLADIV